MLQSSCVVRLANRYRFLKTVAQSQSNPMKAESEKRTRKIFIGVLAVTALALNVWFFFGRDFSEHSKSVGRQSVDSQAALTNSNQGRIAEDEKLLEKYFDTAFTKKSGNLAVAFYMAGSGGNQNPAIHDALVQKLSAGNTKLITSFFREAFLTDGLFESAFAGPSAVADKLKLSKYLDGFVLVKETVKIQQNSSELANVLTANIRLDIAVISCGNNIQGRTWTFTANGAGFKTSDAQAQAEERLIKQLSTDSRVSL